MVNLSWDMYTMMHKKTEIYQFDSAIKQKSVYIIWILHYIICSPRWAVTSFRVCINETVNRYKKMVSATLNHYKGGVRMGLQNMSVLVCTLIFMYAFWKWRWLWRVCVRRFRDVSELEEAIKQGGHREPLHYIRSHQWIWPQHHPDLQPTHVGEAGDGVKMRTWFPGLLCSSPIQNMFQRGR